MKVPNKVLNIIYKLSQYPEQVQEDERKLVREWAEAGITKRATPTAAPKES